MCVAPNLTTVIRFKRCSNTRVFLAFLLLKVKAHRASFFYFFFASRFHSLALPVSERSCWGFKPASTLKVGNKDGNRLNNSLQVRRADYFCLASHAWNVPAARDCQLNLGSDVTVCTEAPGVTPVSLTPVSMAMGIVLHLKITNRSRRVGRGCVYVTSRPSCLLLFTPVMCRATCWM